ncbi:YigZ family protein [Mycoplasma sp. 128]|uniref:YigZ family protein n=1 Tax=Mycoplasma sp. 3341 TaxID=3447506 RepID=UPI003F6553B1
MYEIEIKKSRFLAYVYSVSNENQIHNYYAQLYKEHKRCRHVCYAYRIKNNDGSMSEKGFDDGEPKNSAGLPLLNLLQLKNVENLAVFVVRYFGGKLLGRSKLPGAYIKAAKEEIETFLNTQK